MLAQIKGVGYYAARAENVSIAADMFRVLGGQIELWATGKLPPDGD
jgi:hypothetical protein